MSDCVLFWVPRDMVTMPALTTNDEWGVWKNSGKVVFGSPIGAHATRYQHHYANKLFVPNANTLEETVKLVVAKLGNGAWRENGEREVPLLIWQSASFQQWYSNLKAAGNRLDHAHVHWTFRTGPKKSLLFLWALACRGLCDKRRAQQG